MESFISARAIAFDCFGTLCEVTRPTHPYRDVLALLQKHFQPPAKHAIMTRDWSFQEAIAQLGVPLDEEARGLLERRLADELDSIAFFQESISVLRELRLRGYKLAVCANIPKPYAEQVDLMLADSVDHRTFSYACGFVKPDRRIFQDVQSKLRLPAEEILMVGTEHLADYSGARAAGMRGMHLTRPFEGQAHPAGQARTGAISRLTDLLYYLPPLPTAAPAPLAYPARLSRA
jgi:FMN phosphatase YigB (HAD superfamily)